MIKPYKILQINTHDVAGGAAKIALELCKAYLQRGHISYLAVGQKNLQDRNVIKVPHPRFLGAVQRSISHNMGWDLLNFPGTKQILTSIPFTPDIIHCHNLHGEYFDLNYLPEMSKKKPLFITLHDNWLLCGHCANTMGCEKWKKGCGNCPDLTIPPAILHDGTARNFKQRKKIFSAIRIYVASPSQWLMSMVEQSILSPSVIEGRVIPNGINQKVFAPFSKKTARFELGIEQEGFVLLFVAHGIKENRFKDFQTLLKAVLILNENISKPILLIALGEDAPTHQVGNINIKYIPYQSDSRKIARYYQAADLCVYATKADNFPTVILEALSCGTPVVASMIGGIPEQIKNGKTGFLVPVSDESAIADAVTAVLLNQDFRIQMGINAAEDARLLFSLDQQVGKYLNWYDEVLSKS